VGTRCKFLYPDEHRSQKLTSLEDWNSPYSFFNSIYKARNDDLEITHTFTGSLGTLLGVW
jgi:amino acid transporter